MTPEDLLRHREEQKQIEMICGDYLTATEKAIVGYRHSIESYEVLDDGRISFSYYVFAWQDGCSEGATIPLVFITDRDAWPELHEQQLERERAAKKATAAALAEQKEHEKEARDRATYERLKAKYGEEE